MEEILASIKRVIREDGRAAGQAKARRAARAEAGVVPPSVQPQTSAPVPVAAPAQHAGAPDEDDVLELDESMEEQERLVSENAAAASRQSLAALAAVRHHGGPTDTGPLEAVVREMLRPVLKDWLDEHLPRIVEELVTREIGRITGRSL